MDYHLSGAPANQWLVVRPADVVQSSCLLGCAHTLRLTGAAPVAFPCTHPNRAMRHLGPHSELHLNPPHYEPLKGILQ